MEARDDCRSVEQVSLVTARTQRQLPLPRANRVLAREAVIAQIWSLRDDGRSDHEIANELGQAVIYVRRILAAGRRN